MANPETGEHVPRVDWLPEAATDVCYYKAYDYTAYEFEISEQAFREWYGESFAGRFKEYGIEHSGEIVDLAKISRYHMKSLRLGKTGYGFDLTGLEKDDAWIEIRNGLYWGITHDSGGGIYVAYDRDSGRAYFQHNPR